MIALLLYSLLFVFGLIYTLISAFPSTMKFLAPSDDRRAALPPKQDPIKPVAAATTPTPIGGLRGVFATFDKDDDGYITKKELRESLEKIGIAAGEKDVEDMVQKVDANGDGLIDFGEFCELYESIEGGGSAAEARGDEDLREAFDVFDGNKDGLITVEELGMVLSSLGFTEGKKIEDCKEMIRKVDVDGDGMVNFDEFKKMMKDGLGRLIAVS